MVLPCGGLAVRRDIGRKTLDREEDLPVLNLVAGEAHAVSLAEFHPDLQRVDGVEAEPFDEQWQSRIEGVDGDYIILNIYDMQGAKLNSIKITDGISNKNKTLYGIDLGPYPQGNYFIVLQTMNGVISRPLVILK